jgi:hypothetical protein
MYFQHYLHVLAAAPIIWKTETQQGMGFRLGSGFRNLTHCHLAGNLTPFFLLDRVTGLVFTVGKLFFCLLAGLQDR